MAGERFVERSVEELATIIEVGLPSALRSLEVARGFDPLTLADPVAVERVEVPFDHRSPLVEVSDDGWQCIDQRNRLFVVSCVVWITYLGDSSIADGRTTVRQYLSALLDLLFDNQTLGGKVLGIVFGQGQSDASRGDGDVQTRHIVAQQIDVHIQQSGAA